MVVDYRTHGALEKYLKDIIAHHKDDPRIFIWDLYNEPTNCMGHNRRKYAIALMRKCFRWAREVGPSQPLTVASYRGHDPAFDEIVWAESDIVTFHCYSAFPDFVRTVEWLRTQTDRPLVCNEWLNRIEGNTVETVLPFLHAMGIGSFHWGLIQGFSQTWEPHGAYFEAAKRGERKDLRLWQHDLYRFNGHPYDPREIDVIRAFAPPTT